MGWPFDTPVFLPRSFGRGSAPAPTIESVGVSGGSPSIVAPSGGVAVRTSSYVQTRGIDILPAADRTRRSALPTLSRRYVEQGGSAERADDAARAWATGSGAIALPFPQVIGPGTHPLHAAFEGVGRAAWPSPLLAASRALPGYRIPWGVREGRLPVAPARFAPDHAGENEYAAAVQWNRMLQGVAAGAAPVGPMFAWETLPGGYCIEIATPEEWLPSPSTGDLVRSFAVYGRPEGVQGYPYMPSFAIVAMGPALILRCALQRPVSPMPSIPWLTTVFVAITTVVLTYITAGIGTAVVGLAAAGAVAAAVAGGALVVAGLLERQAREWLEKIDRDPGLSPGDKAAVSAWTRSFIERVSRDARAGR